MNCRNLLGALVVCTAGFGAAYAPAASAQTVVKVAAAEVFSAHLVDVINDFQDGDPYSPYWPYNDSTQYSYQVTTGMSGMQRKQIDCFLKSGVSCDASVPGYPSPNYSAWNFSLFIAADTGNPSTLYTDWSGAGKAYCPSGSCPWTPSSGKLLLWSDGVVDVNSGLTSSTEFGICNTSMGPYGVAAMNVLTAWGYSANPITQYNGVTLVDAAVDDHSVDAGFVPTALHCNTASSPPGGVTLPAGATSMVLGTVYDHGAVLIDTGTGADTAAQKLLEWMVTTAGEASLEQNCLLY